ncbi:hypothetical protein HZC00_03335 [Candidatus Kaiserbacteria bacterium]|nr:hypothetical protein [Candidatus Kaiserbacteria bacterium]
MLSPKTRIILLRTAAGATGALLIIAALGLGSDYGPLRTGIMLGFFVLAGLSLLLRYPAPAIVGIALGLLFNPLAPVDLPRHIWVIIDLVSLAGVIYFSQWATNPYWKGTRFEHYVSTLFPEPDFSIHDRTRDISKFLNRRVESNMRPDFVFRNQKDQSLFAVECKWRGRWAQGKNGDLGLWWDQIQGERYRAYGRESGIPVYVAFGVGGSPEKPKEVYFLDTAALHYGFLKQSIVSAGDTAMQLKEKLVVRE